jgi:hypothetical protein
MDYSSGRQYLAPAPRPTATVVMKDAVVHGHPGALHLLVLLLEARVNRRTRKTVAAVTAAFLAGTKSRWHTDLVQKLWNLYRLMLAQQPLATGVCVIPLTMKSKNGHIS